ncbi:hypothetical protein V6N13_070058 [Hibiscus sabdariffa]|uniref:Uncharacterized protein n=1 Tax=Hibiscus sabdariffa TaxID=183260 RepID=A0ABR2BJF1_9ROSI
MFCFLSKAFLHGSRPIKIEAFKSHNLLYILQTNPSLPFSTTSKQQSFTVSYLIKTCGLSPESALSASKLVSFETPNQPDSVIAFFKTHGFSKPQIAAIVGKMPRLLSCKVEKTLLPKIAFLNSKGIPSTDLTKLFAKYPYILASSLEKKIIPSFNFISNLLKSDSHALHFLFAQSRCLSYILPNNIVLRQNGVPELNIAKGLLWFQSKVPKRTDVFKENVEKVKKMGFSPERFNFVLAVHVLGSMSKSTWERKFDVYNKCGWSEKEILEAFRRNPSVMAASEDKIKAVIDFLVNVMGFEASSVAKQPYLLGLSMEKRIVPRGLFAKDLMSMGLLEKKLGLKILFETSEELFLQRFVYCYKEEASELLKLYNEKLKLAAGGKHKTDKL